MAHAFQMRKKALMYLVITFNMISAVLEALVTGGQFFVLLMLMSVGMFVLEA
jgi:hypothetical protein